MIDYMVLRYFLLGMAMHCFCSFRCCCRQVLVVLGAIIVAEYERHYERHYYVH